jgi:phage-related protein
LELNGERPLAVVFFRTEAGNEPVRDWLRDLPKDERKAIGEDILTVQFAWPVGKPLMDAFGGGLWEVRSKLKDTIARTLFIIHDEEIVLLHGFIKKDRKTPKPDLDLAKKRMKQFLHAHE